MIESITLAEFHETEGARCVVKYPSSLVPDDLQLENLILPEGLHNHLQDSTITIIRRPQKCSIYSHPKYLLPRFKRLSELVYRIDVFKYCENDWVQVSPETAEGCRLSVVQKASKVFFEVRCESRVVENM